MNRDETHALYQRGKDAWNAWAGDMLGRRAVLKTNGEWQIVEARASLGRTPSSGGRNEATRNWLYAASAEFSSATDGKELKVADFQGYIFPGDAAFDGATFSGVAHFDYATFFADVRFRHATFFGDARFQRASFRGRAEFGEVTFWRRAGFDETEFLGAAGFRDATFSGGVSFRGATFQGRATFRGATFSRDTIFSHAKFRGGAKFRESRFNGFTTYSKAVFSKEFANFSAIRSEGAFLLANAKFDKVPDFIQAHFEEAPRFDNLQLDGMEMGRRRSRTEMKCSRQADPNMPARYRALKRLAIQGHDKDAEINFFAQEIISLRFVTDFPCPKPFRSRKAWSASVRFWLRLLYQVVSDFGRSLVRPLLLWLVTAMLAAGYFLSESPAVVANRTAAGASDGVWAHVISRFTTQCFAGPPDAKSGDGHVIGLAEELRSSTTAPMEALHLALRNALVFVDSGPEAAHRTLGCLYGVDQHAVVPSKVALASALQKVVSGILIFLFGLALRNMLRVK